MPGTDGNRVKICVAYGWQGETARTDARWKSIRENLEKYAAEAAKREKTASNTDIQYTISRLRAGVGEFIWRSITQRIEESDIFIADITPKEGERTVPANVMLELGYALARPNLPVFVITQGKFNPKLLPSDLHGLLVGTYATARKDASLRASVVAAIRSCVARGAKNSLS